MGKKVYDKILFVKITEKERRREGRAQEQGMRAHRSTNIIIDYLHIIYSSSSGSNIIVLFFPWLDRPPFFTAITMKKMMKSFTGGAARHPPIHPSI